MSNHYTAIILAAGMGSRLRPLTDDIPKCMVEVGGKPILEWQLDRLQDAGIEHIVVVTGYLEDKIGDPRVMKVHNADYSSTNMVYSLFHARDYLQGDLIISYGDIIYSKEVLHKLMNSEGEAVVASDLDWLSYWNQRCDDPLSDAETFRTGPQQTVRSLGQPPRDTAEIEGQFIGLMKFTDKGCRQLKEAYHGCRENSACSKNAWNSGRDLRNAYMTDLLNHLAGQKKLHYTPIRRGWFEVDTPGDLDIANEEIEKEINI